MSQDIVKGHHYKATIVGYNNKNSLFVELNNKFTAYLDISKYDYTDEEVKQKYRVMSVLDVVVTNIDKSDSIRCVECDTDSDVSPKKQNHKKQSKSKKSEHLTYDLSSLMSNIKINAK